MELTRTCGFPTKLEDKPGTSIMADQGFTVKDMLEVGHWAEHTLIHGESAATSI